MTTTKKLLSLILAIAFLISGSNLMFITSFAADMGAVSISELPKINVWLIAGQSNAMGYAQWSNYPDTSAYAKYKTALETGVDNVLYMGTTDTAFTPTKASATRTGAEVGIATSYMDSGEMNAIIKVAWGNTSLYNNTTSNESKTYGTWTPPTYIKNHNIDTSDNKVGDLYNTFMDKIEYGLGTLAGLGYNPQIKGIWYMQGEADTLNTAAGSAPSDAYEEMLTTLISDMRTDITEISGSDCSELPFVYGRVYRNPGTDPSTGKPYTDTTPYLDKVQAAQDAVAAKNIKNVRMINTTTDLVDPVTGAKHTPVQQDGWHYDSLTQQAIGERVVDTVEALNYTPQVVTNSLLKYVAADKQHLNNDGYIGIPVDISTYYDQSKGAIKSGYNGTPIILYVTNTNTTRVGTASDESIISSMLNRGYVVVNIDYLNNIKATGQDLDWSVQGILQKAINKEILTDSIFPSGQYYDSYVVPSGYDISLNNVYWEYDKHASDGSLELILDNWNTDFKGIKAEKLLKWVYNNGTRKPVANAKDGTSPVWYNASGSVDANGEYTKVKYTAPTEITELVKPDGSPLQMDQKMNIIYPVNPSKKVPVLCIASSSEYLSLTPQVADRPHLTGALFRGYAGVTYDYAFFPMLYNDAYGSYNGSTSTYPNAVTNDSDNYSVHMYNNKRVTTAAMRFIRYKALSEPDTFKLDTDNIGIIGNSKGGAMSFLGEKIVQSPLVENPSSYATTDALESAIDEKINSFISRRAHPEHHNETRYQNGKTESYTDELTGVTIDGGEKQPWLTYNGKEIISGAQLIWASNGVNEEDISEGHSPQIVMCHRDDPWHYYGPLNYMANICHSHDIPALVMEVPLPHTVAHGPDMNYNLDSYDKAFDFINYYLKDEAVKVLWTDPQDGYGNIGVTNPITVKFSGAVPESEIEKVTVSDEDGNTITGTWKSIYGNTEWKFTPDVLKGNTLYTITVPADLKGDNGIEMGSKYTASIYTKKDINNEASASYTTQKGTYFTLTAPTQTDASNLKVRFRVTNDAANVAALYAVTNFNSSSPDSSTVGDLIGKVNLKGTGYYEIDASEYLLKNKGSNVTFLLKQDKETSTSTTFKSDFSSLTGYTAQSTTNMSLANAPDGTASMKLYQIDTGIKHANGQHKYYNNRGVKAVTVNNILKKSLTEDDYGRKFKISVKVYDTISRWFQLQINTNTNSTYQTVDYENSMYNYMTKAKDWTTFTFDYVVYDTDFGKVGFRNKNLTIGISHTGDLEIPLYIGEIKVEEEVTEINADNFSLALGYDSSVTLKEAESDKAFFLYDANGTKVSEHDGWNDALNAYKYGYTLKLMKNYTLTDDDLWSNFGISEGANGDNGHIYNIDLNGYTISSLNSKNSLFWLKNSSSAISKTTVNVKNGGILLKNTPLVSYESSTTSGSGKKFDVNLTNINIGFLDNAMMDTIISNNTITSGAGTTVDINLNECEIDLPDVKHTPEYKTVFPSGSGDLTINYNITGGSLNLTSLRWITIKNDLASSNFYKGTDGKYMILTLSNNAFAPEISCMLEGSSVAPYNYKSTTNNVASYELEVDLLSTRYGVIPSEYEDVDTYPFVLFDESGTFKGASSELFGNTSTTSIADMARVYLKDNVYNTTTKSYGTSPKAAFVVMRKDYTLASGETHGNLAQLQGVLTIDLNGHTLTQNNKPIIDSTAKGWTYSGDQLIFPSEIAFENGKILLKNNSLINFIAWDSTGDGAVSGKEFTHTYNDVTFGLVAGGTASSLFTYGTQASTPNATATFKVNINDCKFDFKTVAPTSKITLFSAGSSTLTNNIVITGSEIYADSMTNIALSSITKGSVTANKNSDGDLLKVYVTEANKGTFTSSKVTTAGGESDFIETTPVDDYAVFTLEDLEEDIPVPAHITSVTAARYNSSFELETVDVDTTLLSDGSATTPEVEYSQIKYENSTVVANNNLDSDENAGQHWLITLNDVCKPESLTAIYSYTNKWVDFNVKVSEDNITWTDLGTIRPEVAANKDDPVTIPLSSSSCKYIKLSVVKRNGTGTNSTESTVWGPNLSTGGCTVALYELSVNEAQEEEEDNSIVTPYGKIPSEYASVDNYPFVWFDEQGNFKGASNCLYGWNSTTSIIGQAKDYMAQNAYSTATNSYGDNEKKAFILLRRDYTMSNETYGNMSQIQGTVTIDLNGFKISQSGSTTQSLVYSQIKPWIVTGEPSLFPTELSFKNGTIVLKNTGLGNFSTWTSDGIATDLTDKKFTHTYTNIKFMLAEDATMTDLFTVTDGNHTAHAYVNIIDCTFDFITAFPTTSLRMFNGSGTRINVDYNITGSKIYTDTMAKVTLSEINEGSSIVASKNSDGEYLKVYVTSTNKDTFKEEKMAINDGEAEFIETGSSDTYAVYTLKDSDDEFDPIGLISYHNNVFTSTGTVELGNGQTYTGPIGVVFAKAVETSGDYTRTEYGVILSETEMTLDELKKSPSAIWAKGEKISPQFQFGIRFYGNKIKEGKTYYTLPYAIYENSNEDTITVYGSQIITFKP